MDLHGRMRLVPERLEEAAVAGRHEVQSHHAARQPFSCSISSRLASFSSLERIGRQGFHIGAHRGHTGQITLIKNDN